MFKKIKNQSGFSHVEAFLILVVIVAIGAVGFYVAAKHPGQAQAASSSQVYRWGNYAASTDGERNAPVAIGDLTNIVSVQASNASSYALQCVGGLNNCATDGVEWSFGPNSSGELGDNSTKNSLTTPVLVQFPTGVYPISMGEAFNSGFAVSSTGQGWAWGASNVGLCVGGKSNFSPKVPTKVPAITSATAVQGGSGHVVWLMSNGTVKECDQGDTTPYQVAGLSNIVAISAGNDSTAALDSSGNVWMWGNNALGQIGNGTVGGYVYTPIKVSLPAPVKQVYVGGDHLANGQAIALLTNGLVYAWGNGTHDQLGNGVAANTGTPVKVSVPTGGVAITAVATGGDESFVLDASGRLWQWGNGSTKFRVADAGVVQISATAGDILDLH